MIAYCQLPPCSCSILASVLVQIDLNRQPKKKNRIKAKAMEKFHLMNILLFYRLKHDYRYFDIKHEFHHSLL